MIGSSELLSSVNNLKQAELAWLSGYCWARLEQEESQLPTENLLATLNGAAVLAEPSAATPRRVLVLYASQTGNAKGVAEQLQQQLQTVHDQVQLQSVGDYKNRDIGQEDIVLLISSTQGEGEYPEQAISFAKFLFSKRAPDLSQVSFAVLGLGDSSYPFFCESAKKFDQRFAELGAKRLQPRVDCDLDYQGPASQWQSELTLLLKDTLKDSLNGVATPVEKASAAEQSAVAAYSKERPYTASVIARQQITSRDASKVTEHIEIDLADSGIEYQAGDVLGVYVKNDPALIAAVLTALQLDGQATVQLSNGQACSLEQALSEHFELTQNNPVLVRKWAELTGNPELQALIADSAALQEFASQTPLVAMLQNYAANIDAQAVLGFLRPLTPRMYSIASAQDEVGEEVHLTLGRVQYQHQGQDYSGVASAYLGQQLEEDDQVQVFVEANTHFRLPENTQTPIIMIGAGTGIAPYRAFLQQRESDQAAGGAWLIFGNHKFTDDFLYQSEWQRWHQLGLLSKTSFAWSRQNPKRKTYVQDKIIENGQEVWQWLQQGAHIYVCGDANNMAKAVEAALLQVIHQFGSLNPEDAETYLDELRDERRYQRDVY